jgi:putative phosphoribosyl transferase
MEAAMRFHDRRDAGRQLADRLATLPLHDPVVLALPRGGVPVAAEIASRLQAPLEVFLAAKVGAPGHEELGVGAVAEGLDVPVVGEAAAHLGLSAQDVEHLASRARTKLDQRLALYRGARPLPPLEGRDVIVVDDGLATGATAEAALKALRGRGPRRLLLAVPVCARESAERLAGLADDVLCLATPADFLAVGAWYEDFSPTTDAEVLNLLGRAEAGAAEGR